MPVRETLAGISIVLDMSSRDYYGFRDDAFELIPVLTPLWTDLHPNDPGVVTIELFSAVADNLSFYEDRNANENFLYTATQRASVLKFARFASYTPRQNTSAVVDIDVTVSGAGTVQAGFLVGTQPTQDQEQVSYELRSEYVAAGAGTYSLEFIEGESYEEILGSSDGTADQSFFLSRYPIAYNPDGTSSLQVWVKEGVNPWEMWTLASSFVDSSATDQHYVVYVDEDDILEVVFGDGVNGKLPPSGTDNIKSIARVGGGELGNQVGTNLITEILDGSPGIVTAVTNPAVPQGGEDKASIDEIKEAIPRWIRQNDRCVTEDDYALEAEEVGGVASAKATRGDWNYQVDVYVRAAGMNPSPAGAWDPRTETGNGLIGQVGAAINTKREGPVQVNIQGPYKVRAFFDATVYIHDTFMQEQVQERVERAISACFNGYEIDSDGKALGVEEDIPSTAALPGGFPRNMGDDLKKSYLNHLIESISGVDYVDITRLHRDPYAKKSYDFGSDATFSQIVIGASTVREVWTVRFTSPTEFEVMGSISGLQATTGTVGVEYVTAGSEITFTITAGAIPNFKDNQYEITVGPYLDTIEIGDFELLTNYVGSDTVYATWNLVFEGGIT